MIGQTVSHYKILAKIGSGGMGEIYLAEDTKLERRVALKFLPPELSRDPDAKSRFVHEARAASALDHPNICTVYDIGEDPEGRMFMVMPYYEGSTLKEILARGGITEAIPAAGASVGARAAAPLAINDATAIAAQIAEGLSAAHAKGIVHRDLKPANIFMTKDNRAKILDFGIAKLAGSKTKLTKTGSTVGTVAYMSPEQAMGKEVDLRTDVWSLGVILYEMLAGALPFRGDYDQAVVYSILHKEPPSLATTRSDVPGPLRRIVRKALAKDAELRYQSIAELRGDLKAVAEGTQPLNAKPKRFDMMAFRTWKVALSAAAMVLALLLALDIGGVRKILFAPGTASFQAIRLAVLPFANLSGDPQQEYFSDGLTQEMIAQLGKLHPQSLSVIARTSVMRYKNSNTPIDQIGRELGVEYVLEGSARREGSRVKVAAELIRVKNQAQLWADTYEREMSGILTLQNDVAGKVAGVLALKLLPSELNQLKSTHVVNPEAYEDYLKGSFYWKRLKQADLETAQRYFELALEKDPAYAPAYEGLAWVWAVRQQVGITAPREAGPRAKATALQAIALDDRSAEAHEALALVKTWIEWDWSGAEQEWRRTLELNPNAANAHAYYAHFLANMGRADEALPHSERALKLDPFNTLYQGMHALVLVYQRRYDEALAAANATLAQHPDAPIAGTCIQYVQIIKGMRDEQLASQRKRIAGDPERVAAFEQGLAEAGYKGAQRRIADLLAARHEKSGGVSDPGVVKVYLPCAIALRYFDAGEYDLAIDWCERAYEERDPNLPYMANNPLYDPLRSNPRMQALLKRMGIPTGEVK